MKVNWEAFTESFLRNLESSLVGQDDAIEKREKVQEQDWGADAEENLTKCVVMCIHPEVKAAMLQTAREFGIGNISKP